MLKYFFSRKYKNIFWRQFVFENQIWWCPEMKRQLGEHFEFFTLRILEEFSNWYSFFATNTTTLTCVQHTATANAVHFADLYIWCIHTIRLTTQQTEWILLESRSKFFMDTDSFYFFRNDILTVFRVSYEGTIVMSPAESWREERATMKGARVGPVRLYVSLIVLMWIHDW